MNSTSVENHKLAQAWALMQELRAKRGDSHSTRADQLLKESAHSLCAYLLEVDPTGFFQFVDRREADFPCFG